MPHVPEVIIKMPHFFPALPVDIPSPVTGPVRDWLYFLRPYPNGHPAMTHPLACPWTFYYFQRPSSATQDASYEDLIHKIGKFDQVEDFWAYYSHLVRADQLPPSISLHLFRNDSRAMWEDPENRSGGNFILRFSKGQVKYAWETLLLNLIGEQLPADIHGAVLSVRPKFDLIHVWHRTAQHEVMTAELCNALVRALALPPKTKLEHTPFSSMMNTSVAKQSVQYIVESDGSAKKIMHRGPGSDA
jgi:translation initiation factor 4E